MPTKLQIKLLSQSAELLSITNCSAGHISVLRAESPSELRPYQRALSGHQGRERFIITVNGVEYKTEDHNLIGFGEIPPHSGLTVYQYLSSVGLIEGAISGLLTSFGIEGIAQQACSALSPDEERKVRLFAAVADPTKVIVINEPFEPIHSSWRERVSEFLADFVRTKNGLVIVTSLSYRPDSWIDNPIISRHQVGQSLRKTIGFGSAGSEGSQLINQLRDQIHAEHTTPVLHQANPQQRSQATTMSVGAAALLGSDTTELEGDELVVERASSSAWSPLSSATVTTLKAGGALGAGGLGIWAALALIGILPGKPQEKPPAQVAALVQQDLHPQSGQHQSNDNITDRGTQSGATGRQSQPSEPAHSIYLLDRYPEAIRTSILDTSKGGLGEVAIPEAPIAPAKAANDTSGNFYNILESASTDKSDLAGRDGGWQQPESDAGGWHNPDNSYQGTEQEFNPTEEEERREAIRQKFLEAIRAAAQRHEQEDAE
jgi:hypothetical protein